MPTIVAVSCAQAERQQKRADPTSRYNLFTIPPRWQPNGYELERGSLGCLPVKGVDFLGPNVAKKQRGIVRG